MKHSTASSRTAWEAYNLNNKDTIFYPGHGHCLVAIHQDNKFEKLKKGRITDKGRGSSKVPSKAQASWTSLTAACSTMFLTRNLLIALS